MAWTEAGLTETAEMDERDLLRRVRDGDRDAFGRVVERYMRQAHAAALGLVGCHATAMDLSQDAFVRAFNARGTLDPERPFYPWLYRILRNLCFNFLRDRKFRGGSLRANAKWLVEAPLETVRSGDPADAAERAELRERLQEAIAGLPEKERETLVLREFQHRSYREIADLLGIPIGTVMSRLFAARRSLAERMEVHR